jgi:hypothetical protein
MPSLMSTSLRWQTHSARTNHFSIWNVLVDLKYHFISGLLGNLASYFGFKKLRNVSVKRLKDKFALRAKITARISLIFMKGGGGGNIY